MSTRRPYRATIALLFTGLFGWSGCSADAGADSQVSVYEEQQYVISFEEYRDQAVRVIDGQVVYNVEWDLYFKTEEALYEHYLAELERQYDKAVIMTNASTGADLKFDGVDALNITYCVSDTFGVNQAQAIDDMDQATRAWEAVTNIDFEYVPGENDNCAPTTPGIVLAMLPDPTLNGGYGTPSFLPSSAVSGYGNYQPGTLIMDYPNFPWGITNMPNLTTVGVVRHELGHIIGLRHEHPWAANPGGCSESQTWVVNGRPLTENDVDSVMYYPWCNGNLNSALTISELDGVGIRQVYGMPAAWYTSLM